MAEDMPWFKWFPMDYLTDPNVRRTSIFARGLLGDLLSVCYLQKQRGRFVSDDGERPWSDVDIVTSTGGKDIDKLLEALQELLDKEVLSRDTKGVVYSRRIVRDEEIRSKRVASGKKGGKQKASNMASKPLANSYQTLSNSNSLSNSSSLSDTAAQIPDASAPPSGQTSCAPSTPASAPPLSPKKKKKVFKKPTVQEIRDYCAARDNRIDAQKFYDFYESKGWMVGKNLMKDWQAAVRTWESRDESPLPSSPYDPRGNAAAADRYLDRMEGYEDG